MPGREGTSPRGRGVETERGAGKANLYPFLKISSAIL